MWSSEPREGLAVYRAKAELTFISQSQKALSIGPAPPGDRTRDHPLWRKSAYRGEKVIGTLTRSTATAAKTSPKKLILVHSIFIAIVPTNLLCQI